MPSTVSLTHGQIRRMDDSDRGIERKNIGKLSPERQVGAIKHFVDCNQKCAAGDLFVASDATKQRKLIAAIGAKLGLRVEGPGFQRALQQAVLTRPANPPSAVIGAHGYVPASIVERITDGYGIDRDTVVRACNNYANEQGDNGIKTLETGRKNRSRIAELKLLAMRGERVYASQTDDNNRYIFDKIGKHT